MTVNTILLGNNIETLKTLPDSSVNCCVTSPPYYGLRNYETEGQIGLEETPNEYIEKLVGVFREVKRVLRDDGTLWVVIADSYAGSGKGGSPTDRGYKQSTNAGSSLGNAYLKDHETIERCNVTSKTFEGIKAKDLIGIPWMLAFSLRADGWFLRQDIVWAKPNPMPESVTDRCTKSHEYIFLLSKSPRYYFNSNVIKEPAVNPPALRDRANEKSNITMPNGTARFSQGMREYNADGKRNKRDVWTVSTKPYSGAHFAVFPQELILPCILSGCPENGIVLDPFMGSGTTALVAMKNFRNFIGCEINPDYVKIAEQRIADERGLFDGIGA
jgi:DNA modification methylase